MREFFVYSDQSEVPVLFEYNHVGGLYRGKKLRGFLKLFGVSSCFWGFCMVYHWFEMAN